MDLPVVYSEHTRPIDVAKDVRAQLPADYVGEFLLRVRMPSMCAECGPQEWSASDRFMVCPQCGAPTQYREV